MLDLGMATIEQNALPRTGRGKRSRPVEDRLAMRFPALAMSLTAWFTKLVFRLPRRWRIRQRLIEFGTRRAFDAVARGDLAVQRTVNHPDATWELSRWEWPEQPLYHGHDGIVRFTGMWIDQWSEMDFEVVSIEELEARRVFLVHLHLRAIGRASGAQMEQDIFKLVTIRDGLVWRGMFFRDRAEALEVAGAGA
jgi:ketosteroid isomerase-like protein